MTTLRPLRGLLANLSLALLVAGIAGLGALPAPGLPVPAEATDLVATPSPVTPEARVTTETAPTSTPILTAAHSPTPRPSVTPAPTTTSTPSATPIVTPTREVSGGVTIGVSALGQPIVAYRFGQGPFKVALVADIHGAAEANTYDLAQQLVAHYQAVPEVPERVSLWIIPTLNPDGLATGHRWNAHDVDLNRNADTDLDGCGGNDWTPDSVGLEGEYPGAGGPYPFSEPETRALRDFLADAWVAVFYHSAAGAIYADTCQRHLPSARLAAALAAGSGYSVPAQGWAGYPIRGDFADYLAGEGVAAVTVELTDHTDAEFDRNLAGVQSMLGSLDEILGAETAAAGAEMVWLDEGNTGVWRYPQNSFPHPLAVEVIRQTAYVLDGGRVLALDLSAFSAPRRLLAPGDQVDGIRVLEPLDLAVEGESLLVLDRAGDVYRHDPRDEEWTLALHGRPSGNTYDHYFVALAAAPEFGLLMETTHEQMWKFSPGQSGSAVGTLPVGRDVDLSVAGHGIYALTRDLNGPRATLTRYALQDADHRLLGALRLGVDVIQPRQVLATEETIYLLDRAGRRVLALEPGGALRAIYQFTDRRTVGAIWAGKGAGSNWGALPVQFVMAGTDALYFYGEPGRRASAPQETGANGTALAHDPAFLERLRGLIMPIQGATITRRDFQMPGAPRHYRLGVHEGIDFYTGTAGVTIDARTPVRAVADGVIVRALTEYSDLTAAEAQRWAAQCRALGYTPPEVLDGYRGRQVWIEHDGGLVSRYAHLSAIAPGIAVGARVERGQVIGRVGNSGTPDSVRSATIDVHLHLELWVGEEYIGQFLRPIETREWLERILR